MDRLRRLGERWPWLGRALEVHTRFGEVNGGPIASSVTLMSFLSLFPLALVAISIVGFVSAGDTDVAARIVDALSLTGAAATTVTDAINTAEQSRKAASIIGFVGLAWAALGVTSAMALAVQTPWQSKPSGLRTRVQGVAWLLGAVALGAGSAALGALVGLLPDWSPPVIGQVVLIGVGLAVEVGFFLWTFWMLGDRRLGLRSLLPGAVFGAVGLEVLKLVATVWVPRLVAHSSALYGSLGVVFAILAWLALFARLVVYSSTLNAVLHEVRKGTVTLEIKAPRIDPEVPIEADRGGAVVHPEPVND